MAEGERSKCNESTGQISGIEKVCNVAVVEREIMQQRKKGEVGGGCQ